MEEMIWGQLEETMVVRTMQDMKLPNRKLRLSIGNRASNVGNWER